MIYTVLVEQKPHLTGTKRQFAQVEAETIADAELHGTVVYMHPNER